MRRSVIRTIQKTRKSKNDSYANPTNGVAYDIQIEIPTLSINSNIINSIDFK
jgi:hypothetical protein